MPRPNPATALRHWWPPLLLASLALCEILREVSLAHPRLAAGGAALAGCLLVASVLAMALSTMSPPRRFVPVYSCVLIVLGLVELCVASWVGRIDFGAVTLAVALSPTVFLAALVDVR